MGMVKVAMGRHLDRNGILATPDCRGGVFAVFAKISPPVAHPSSPPRASPCPPFPALCPSTVGTGAFVATWRAASRIMVPRCVAIF